MVLALSTEMSFSPLPHYPNQRLIRVMTLPPIPPSDNLYKFTAIGGLILAVLSLYVPQQILTQHMLSTIEANWKLEKAKENLQVFDKAFEEAEESRKGMIESLKKVPLYEVSPLNLSQEMVDKGEQWIRILLEDRDKLIKLFMERLDRFDDHMRILAEGDKENKRSMHQSKIEMEKLTYLKPRLDKLFWTSVGTFSLGVIMMIFGFWNWYYRFQIYQDQIVKAQAAQWTKPPKPETPERDEVPGEI